MANLWHVPYGSPTAAEVSDMHCDHEGCSADKYRHRPICSQKLCTCEGDID